MSVLTRLHETGTMDEKLTCPYNISHVMTAYKFQSHLIKCRKQNPDKAKDITICPYNQIHHVRTVDMAQHLQLCPQYLHFQRTVVARKVHSFEQSSGAGVPQFLQDKEVTPREAAERGLSGIVNLMQRPKTPPSPPTEDDLSEWQ